MFDPELTNPDTLTHESVVDLQFSPDGTALYLAQLREDGTVITRVVRETGLLLQRQLIPGDTVSGLWLLPDGRTLATTGAHDLYLLDASLSHRVTAIDVCEGSIRGFFPSGVRGRAYAVCAGDTLVEIDTNLERVIRATNNEPCGMEDVAVSPNGTLIYVLCRSTGRLVYVDRLTLAPFDSVSLETGGQAMAVTPDGRKAAITRPAVGDVIIVDLRRRSVESRVQTDAAQDVVIGMDGRVAYVTAGGKQGSGRLLGIDLTGASILREARTLSGALRITVWPGPESPILSVPAF